MTKYIKTGTTEFEQFDLSKEMSDKYGVEHYRSGFDAGGTCTYGHRLQTLEGTLEVHLGDWIATGVNGEHWPVKDEIFKKEYERLPKLTRPVSRYLEYCKEHWNLNDAFLNAEYLVSDKDGAAQLDYFSEHPDEFARAWLDGYQVEVDE